jgi:hypothetical protein
MGSRLDLRREDRRFGHLLGRVVGSSLIVVELISY